MKIDIKAGVSHSTKLNRKILQALNMLQQSQMELRETVLQALESNIMLEEVTPAPGSEAADDASDSAQEPEEHGDPAEEQAAAESPDEQSQADITWEDMASFDGTTSFSQKESKVDAVSLHSPEKTLREYLLEQVPYLNLDDVENAMAKAIIDAIDDRGYLAEPLKELAALFPNAASPEQMPGVLARIQKLDPPGVAARTPQECLQLQLRQLLQDHPEDSERIEDALLVVDEAIKLLAAGEAAGVRNYFGWPMERAEQAVELIRSLRPYPGADFESSPTRHVVPEVYVRREQSRWKVEMSQGYIPRLRINPSYMDFMAGAGKGASQSSLRSHLQEAQWLLESLRSRAEVVLKVSGCIVRHQENFLKFGEEALRPLTLEEVAQEVGVHASTVSRATMGKHMHTPQGIYPFRFFFPSLVRTEYAVGTSSTAVKALIKKIVTAEDPDNPLSDGEISDSLENRGVKVARRTVAKYRIAMNIPARKNRRRGKAQR